AGRLNRLVTNLLAMTRLEDGMLDVRRSWHPIEEIVGAALQRLEPLPGNREITVELPRELPLVPLDDVLIEQVLFNRIDNALKHAPSGGSIAIGARSLEAGVVVWVGDRGPGLPP